MRLALTTYKPNFNEPRVRRRVGSVLDWCSHHLSERKPKPVHHDVLHRVFGNATNQLTKFLRANLLIQTGTYEPGKFSFSYLLKREGFDKLLQCTQHMVATSAVDAYPELQSLEFTYSLKSDRYFHRLQQLPSDEKTKFWAGYLPYNYDVEACAPTVLFQLARRAGLPEESMQDLRGYLDDKSRLREHVRELTGLSLKDAKRLINSLFNGARLARSRYCSIFRMLRCDKRAMERLQASGEIGTLRSDIRRVWQSLEKVERVKHQASFKDVVPSETRLVEKKLKTGSQKWCFYFSQERKILEAIVDELQQRGVKHFTEHDGFRTAVEIDPREMEAVVLARTGFEIKLKSQ